jgi:hypothetical protein
MMKSPNPAGKPAPRDGDVVVASQDGEAPRYTVGQFPGVVQFGASEKKKAVERAKRFAERQAVDLWYCEDGAYSRMGTFRARGSSD